jgi:protein phosphatase
MGRVRENNEDKHEFYLTEDEGELATRGSVFVVCDGMGGHEAGQIASEVAIKTFLEAYRSHPAEDPGVAAAAGVAGANRYVNYLAKINVNRKGMGTTLSSLMIIQDQAVIAHVGDSRVYLLRNGMLKQVTTDHTWVEETVAQGILSREEAEVHPYRHMITRAVGVEEALQCDVFIEQLEAGDRFVLCSDGLTNHVTDEGIREALGGSGHPCAIAIDLVNRALADGGSDNVTAVVVRIDAMDEVDEA